MLKKSFKTKHSMPFVTSTKNGRTTNASSSLIASAKNGQTTNVFSPFVALAKNGFTLVELLVVMVILGILISLAIWGISQAQKNTRDGARKNNLKQIQLGVENFYNQGKTLPLCNSDAGCSVDDMLNNNTAAFASAGILPSPDKDFSRYKYFTDNKNIYNVSVQLEDNSSSCNGIYWTGGISNVKYKGFKLEENSPCWISL